MSTASPHEEAEEGVEDGEDEEIETPSAEKVPTVSPHEGAEEEVVEEDEEETEKPASKRTSGRSRRASRGPEASPAASAKPTAKPHGRKKAKKGKLTLTKRKRSTGVSVISPHENPVLDSEVSSDDE